MTERGTLINFACRHPDGSMKPTPASTRRAAFCPNCQFTYRGPGCILTPTTTAAQASGKKNSAKPLRREYAPRRQTNNSTGGRWNKGDIVEVIAEYHERNGIWPVSTTAFRDSARLPHSSTVVRHLGSIEEAVRQAQVLLEKGRGDQP